MAHENYEPRINGYTLAVVVKALRKLGLPSQLAGLDRAEAGPLVVTLAGELANLTAFLLLRGLTGRHHDQRHRFIAKTPKLRKLIKMVDLNRRHRDKLFPAVRGNELIIAGMVPTPERIFVGRAGDPGNRTRLRRHVLAEKIRLRREMKLLKTVGFPNQAARATSQPYLKRLREEAIAYYYSCKRFDTAQNELEQAKAAVEGEGQNIEKRMGLTTQKWKMPSDLEAINYRVVDFGDPSSVLNDGTANLLRRYDPKWWGRFAENVEKVISKDIVKYPEKIMFRDPHLIMAASEQSFTTSGNFTHVCKSPQDFNLNALFPEKDWGDGKVRQCKLRRKKEDAATRKWLQNRGGTDHPHDIYRSGRSSTENIVALRIRPLFAVNCTRFSSASHRNIAHDRRLVSSQYFVKKSTQVCVQYRLFG